MSHPLQMFYWNPAQLSKKSNTVIGVGMSFESYCKRVYFPWGKMSRKCWQDLSRGGNLHDTCISMIFFIKSYDTCNHNKTNIPMSNYSHPLATADKARRCLKYNGCHFCQSINIRLEKKHLPSGEIFVKKAISGKPQNDPTQKFLCLQYLVERFLFRT